MEMIKKIIDVKINDQGYPCPKERLYMLSGEINERR
jgi:hypothetical protein